MLNISDTAEILIYAKPIDMRKSFNGLAELTQSVLNENPQTGKLFVFQSKSKRIVKILIWDRTGFVIYAKKLECGRFKIYTENAKKPINKGELMQFLDGITLGIKHKMCY